MEINTVKGDAFGVLQYDIPKASDNVDAQVVVNCDPKPGSILEDSATVTCTASDNAGNMNECRFDVILIGKHGIIPSLSFNVQNVFLSSNVLLELIISIL